MDNGSSIAKISEARRMLSEAKSMDDILHIRDIAEAARVYAQAAKLGLESQNEAAEIKLRAERKAGELLRQMPKAEGGRPPETITSNTMLPVNTPTLAELGIEKMQSHRWQTIAELAPEVFEEYIQETRAAKDELTSSGAYKMSRVQKRTDELQRQRSEIETGAATMPQGVFEVVVIDPPWPYGTEYDPEGRRAANPYPEMSLDELESLDIPTAENCILWLWTTHKFMRYSFSLLDAWGFRDVAILTWEKDRIGLGSWLRSKSEFCIMAVKGKPKVDLTNQSTVIHGPLREHSRKPDEFYNLVDSLCIGRKLDYFSRSERQGWEVFGNDTTKF